ENGHSAEENQVSSTSASCRRGTFADSLCRSRMSASLRPTYTVPLGSYHAGIRCPHQIWRLTHQSLMLRIHSKYVLAQFSGMNRVRPVSTAAMAGAASGAIFTYHWSGRYGSSTALVR